MAAFGDAVAADHLEKAQIVHFGDNVTLAVPATLDGEGRPQTRVIAPKHCLYCGRCAEICPIGAIESRF
ncbi:MAG: NADH-quinone oxidoreductase subunit I [Christensenellales bacterium]